jgi:hypothetical protein
MPTSDDTLLSKNRRVEAAEHTYIVAHENTHATICDGDVTWWDAAWRCETLSEKLLHYLV